MDTKHWIAINDLKWVQNSNSGQFGRVLHGKLMMFTSADRGAAALLDDKMRTEPSVKVTAAEFEDLQKAGLVANF